MANTDIALLFDLRQNSRLPTGVCTYIQSGDTSDFDGYFIAAAGQVLQDKTSDLTFIVCVPERRAWPYPDEADNSKHDYESSERILATAGDLLRQLCPSAMLVRGLLNQRNFIPWRWVFSELDRYGPVLHTYGADHGGGIKWNRLSQMVDHVRDEKVKSIILDMNGSMGYLDGLVQHLGPEGYKLLGVKLKASGMPITIMAGVQAELKTTTMPMPGRDPRATANAIYYPDAVRVLLRLSKDYDVPLLFVTNNTCNKLLKFQDAAEALEKLGLTGMLRDICEEWYGLPHLKGKCVPFDWISFSAMLLHGKNTPYMTVSRQELHVGVKDPSVLVLRNPGSPASAEVELNLADTELWGAVECVDDIDLGVLLQLAKYAAVSTPTARV